MSRSIQKIAQDLLQDSNMIKIAQDHKIIGRSVAKNALSRYIKMASEGANGEEIADQVIADSMTEQAEETPELLEGEDAAMGEDDPLMGEAIEVLTDEAASEEEKEVAVEVLVEGLGGEEAVVALMENIASELEGVDVVDEGAVEDDLVEDELVDDEPVEEELVDGEGMITTAGLLKLAEILEECEETEETEETDESEETKEDDEDGSGEDEEEDEVERTAALLRLFLEE